MRHIDVETWPRREHYRLFRQFDQPHFNMCANVDVTEFYPAVKGGGIAFTVAVLYVLSRAANDIREFRYRMRNDDVLEHETVHPSMTVLSDDGLFGFCTMEYAPDLRAFAAGANECIATAKKQPTLKDQPGRDDLLFMTGIPWVSFTSFAHPIHLSPADSIPRLAWGKRFADGGRLKMPLSVQGHHALMDGVHVGQYYERVQSYLAEPVQVFGREGA
jgi:chloramphenicol O-acetyltransferase type A